MRSIHRAAPRLPIIIVSADDTLATVKRAMRNGAFDYVLKGADSLIPPIVRAVEQSMLDKEHDSLHGALKAMSNSTCSPPDKNPHRWQVPQREVS